MSWPMLNEVQVDCLCRVSLGMWPTELQRREYERLIGLGLLERQLINEVLTPWVNLTDYGRLWIDAFRQESAAGDDIDWDLEDGCDLWEVQ